MSSLNSSSSSSSTTTTMGNIPTIETQHQQEDNEETIFDSFICCVCLDLLHKPIVLECGHVSCFWCVHKSMDAVNVSHCPICRHPYHYFPTICEMLHFLLINLYPLAYKKREAQIYKEEKVNRCFSPQLDSKDLDISDGSKPSPAVNMSSDMASVSCITSNGSSTGEGNYSSATNIQRTFERVSTSDALCPSCKQLLFRPAVLNCGHVYCEACIVIPEDGIIICKVCEYPHPSDCPNVCLAINNFLEERFPKEYAARRENDERKRERFYHKSPSSCSGSKKSAKNICCIPPRHGEEFKPGSKEHCRKIHPGAGCDYCGMYPIVGDRYRCLNCKEKMGFDLCGACYNTRSKRPGRFNQQHTSEHRFELIQPRDASSNMMLRIVGGYLVNSSGEPVLAIGAIEDPHDGWVAVESLDENLDELDNSEANDGSVEIEFSDAVEDSGDHDHDGRENPPF